MATFRFEVNNRPTRNKTYVVLLCITDGDGKRKRLKTTIELRRRTDFNTKAKQDNWIRTSEPNAKAWNEALTNELEKAKATYRELRQDGLATSERVVDEIMAGERSSSFVQYTRERTQNLLNSGAISNWKKHNVFYNKLQDFLTDSKGRTHDLTFTEITPAFLSKFEAYLHTLCNKKQPEKKLHPNTIEKELRTIRSLILRAIEIEKLMRPERNPFLSFKLKKVITVKEKLNQIEIELLENYPLVESSLMWHCRNYFMFYFYCAGIRAGDLIQLRWGNITTDGRLHYQMGKNHKNRDLILVQKAKDILSHYKREEIKAGDYIFPLLDSSAPFAQATTQEEKDTMPTALKIKLFNQISAKNALINKEIKKLATLAGIEKKVSLHTSRHSFARVAKQKGIDNSMLKDLLAHSSLKTTENYMGSFDTSDTDKALISTFEKDSNPKTELLAALNNMKEEDIETLLSSIKK